MAIVQMQKVAVMAHSSKKEELLHALQEMGVMEVSQASRDTEIDHTDVNFRMAELKFAIETLKDIASKETLKALSKPSTPEEVLHSAHHTDVRGIIDELHKLEELDTSADRRLSEIEAQKEMLRPWISLPYTLDTATETEFTKRLYGTVPSAKNDALVQALAQSDVRADVQLIEHNAAEVTYSAVVWKADQRAFEEVVTVHGWTTVELPKLPNTAGMIYEEVSIEEKTLQKQKQQNSDKRAELSIELPNLNNVRIFMDWLGTKQSAREAIHETPETVTLLGWIEKKRIEHIEDKLHRQIPAVAILKVKPEEGEEPPVLLRNNKLITPFESVTTLYGLPLSSELDPTLYLSPFFALYFALCLTDAGYGLVLALIFGAYLLKTKVKVGDAQLIWLLFISGIASVIVGIPFGGYFGLTPEQVPAFLTKETVEGLWFKGQVWNLSRQSGVDFLQYLSLILGITHIFFGVFLAGWHKWIHGDKSGAFWQHFVLHILLGAALLKAFGPASMADISTYVLYGALALSIWGQGQGNPWYLRPIMGVLGLINFAISLLSNGLSYLRLLALGLVTGAIALAVNQVAIEMSKLFPLWIGIPVMVLIAVGGHLVSIALNALGSFIHSGRLQFIEFFGQFFEGGGRPFSPFHRSNK